MRFYVRKTFKGKNLIGMDIEIPEFSMLETQDNIVCFNKLPVCSVNSQIARDYFIWADDGYHNFRNEYEEIIIFSERVRNWEELVPIKNEKGEIIGYDTVIRESRFSKDEVEYICDNFPHLIEADSVLRFNNLFYVGSDIRDIEKLAMYLNRGV